MAPSEIAVETLPVHVASGQEMSWRIRPLAAVNGVIVVKLPGEELTKSIRSGPDGSWLSPRRARSAIAFLIHPQEGRLPAGDVDWIGVGYPDRRVCFGDLAMPWLAWFAVFSTLGALIVAPLLGKLRRLLW